MPTPTDLDALHADHVRHLTTVTERALRAADAASLVIAAGQLHFHFLDDHAAPFAVNPHFKAWVPILDAPGSFLIITPGAKPVLLFHQPDDFWHAPPAALTGAWTGNVEIRVIKTPAAAQQHVPPRSVFIGEPFPGLGEWGFLEVNPPAALAILHWARAVKSPYELACMREASARAARAHRAAASAFAAGASAFDTHLAYLAAAGHAEAELPYPNIIAHNESAAILHYHDLPRRAAPVRRSMLIDAGAQVRGYAADITRTHAANRDRFAELVAGMEALELALCAQVRAGTSYAAIHGDAHARIAALLVSTGLIQCSAEAAIADGVSRVFFPHGVGHLLGLQVHDVGGHQAAEPGGLAPPPATDPFLRLTRTLEAGTVVTIEPGLYFIPLLLDAARADARGRAINWAAVAELSPYGGVRIEDNVVATTGAPENLSRDAFAALAAELKD